MGDGVALIDIQVLGPGAADPPRVGVDTASRHSRGSQQFQELAPAAASVEHGLMSAQQREVQSLLRANNVF
jgi:hypothetical protein